MQEARHLPAGRPDFRPLSAGKLESAAPAVFSRDARNEYRIARTKGETIALDSPGKA